MARIISTSDEDLTLAAKQINNGELVAFPTETVYGLGARLDDNSLAKIFAAKHRPYSDPLICHFDTAENAKKYLILTDEESEIFDKLSEAFWPGPLTIIAPATSAVPPLVMAGTGCVGVRVPSHPIAHRFLELCGESVAAPSANLFGHVSPTSMEHVKADLGDVENLLIVSGGKATIGIESTVIRLIGKTITVLRPGFITAGQLESISPGNVKGICKDSQKLASPGHETRHYAPNVDTVLAQISSDENAEPIPEKAVIVDFNRKFASVSSKALRYFDLSPVGSVAEAINRVYDTLRDAELTPGAKICLVADIVESGKVGDVHDGELVGSLRDRLLRSASHQIRKYKLV
ncbi:Sua5/YciO/YrdC/YwlC family protein [Tritrichomonas foetus]|uniref:Threonylcarbamoyl-AMP synthase n=1 Tax=Tritrichomonas foetus TaxID=1144522 RepID=A0A1J4L045_9EUKA|nr:Sua5/YciO/YrdC/YwlC family protein [Tritrichomonas foetus]|eukprot:OHT15308.1 Sua5/YciO/YrdC/YwlC family protein [Tritrichomonas foetus]